MEAKIDDQWIPVIFEILPNKEKISYRLFFGIIEYELKIKNINFSVEKMMMDFELAIMMAAKETWPGIIIQGCRFHWGQCLQRFFSKSNMIPLGERSDEFLKIFHCCLSLPMVKELVL